MKELCIQLCPRARLIIEITEEMERDLYECREKGEREEEFKDCLTCSWYGQDVTEGISACEIVTERCSREGRIIYD